MEKSSRRLVVNGRAGIQILISGCQAHVPKYHVDYLPTIFHLEWKNLFTTLCSNLSLQILHPQIHYRIQAH